MKGISAKQKNNCWQITSATVMQPPQQDPRCPAAKDHIITHAAAAPTNLYAAITRRPAETELQSTIELRTTAPEIAEPEPRWRIDAWSSSWSAERIRAWSDHSRACSETVAPFPILLPRHVLFCKTQQLVHPLILRNALRARLLTKSERCENGDFLQKVEVEDVKTKLSCKISLKHWKLKNVKDVKPKLSCKTSLKKWKLNLWKRSFRARLASKSESWTCENEALVRGLPQKVKVELVKTKLSCEPSLKFEKLKLWKWSLNCQFQNGTDPSMIRRQPSVFRNRRAADLPHPPSDARFVLQNTTIGVSANSRLLTKSESWRCENGGFLQKMKVEDVKTKLSCEAFLKKWKLNLWKRSFRARLPSKSESWRCESWKRSFRARRPSKKWKVKMWKQSFRERLCFNFERSSLESEACAVSSNAQPLMWDVFAVRLLCCGTSWLWDVFAVKSFCCEISLMWGFFAGLWGFFAVKFLCCETSLLWAFLLWDFFAVRSLCCETSLM